MPISYSSPLPRGVWKPESIVVTILGKRDGFVHVVHRDHGNFWTPAREIHVLDQH